MYLRAAAASGPRSVACPTPCPLTGGYTNVAYGPCRRRGVVETGQKPSGQAAGAGLPGSWRVRHLALDPTGDHVHDVGALAGGQFAALGDLVPAQQAGAAAGGGGVLGDEDRMATVGGLPAVLVRLGGSKALGNQLAGVPADRGRAVQFGGGPVAAAQAELRTEGLPREGVQSRVAPTNLFAWSKSRRRSELQGPQAGVHDTGAECAGRAGDHSLGEGGAVLRTEILPGPDDWRRCPVEPFDESPVVSRSVIGTFGQSSRNRNWCYDDRTDVLPEFTLVLHLTASSPVK